MLNNEKILPALVRQMQPMGEVLRAEDTLLDIIEKIILDMMEDSKIVILNRITLEFVQKYINEFTGCDCSVEETPESVLIHFIINREFRLSFDFKRLSNNLKLFMPAHLKLNYENRISFDSEHYVAVVDNVIKTTRYDTKIAAMPLNGCAIYTGFSGSRNKIMKGEVVL